MSAIKRRDIGRKPIFVSFRVSKGRRVVRSVIATRGEGCIKMREIKDAGVELGHRQALIAIRYRQEIQRFIVALGTFETMTAERVFGGRKTPTLERGPATGIVEKKLSTE